MPSRNLKTKVATVIIFFAVYFPIALYLKHSYDPSPPLAGAVVVANLERPFFEIREGGYGYYRAAPALDDIADSNTEAARSPYIVYEDEHPLGPAHSRHGDIAKLGHGRFSHWVGIGFIISSSDGTSPDSNGRKYRVVLPP
jgi:hypothetical protein